MRPLRLQALDTLLINEPQTKAQAARALYADMARGDLVIDQVQCEQQIELTV